MLCDFCHGPNPNWRFGAQPFVLDYGEVRSLSDADWAACDACRDLILAGDRDGLVERAMQTAPAIPGALDCEVRELRRWAQGLFFQHRIGCEPARIDR